MSETQAIPEESMTSPFQLTPDSAKKYSEHLASLGFSVWGHGTPRDNPESFFKKGINTKGYSDLLQVAIALSVSEDSEDISGTIADPSLMDHWPHNREARVTNVVLLAIPNPDPDNKLYASTVLAGVINPETSAVDSNLVAAFYEPTTGIVSPNPDFHLTPASHAEWLDTIKSRINTDAGTPEEFETPTEAHPIPQPAPPQSDTAIW